MTSGERNEFLRRAEHAQPAVVAAFLEELGEIRAQQLAFNYASTVPGRYSVATPLIDPDGNFLAAICAVGGAEVADRLPEVGARLREAVDAWRFPRKRRRAGG